MKKMLSFICFTAILLSMTLTAFAGDVPEGLLSSDEAQVFFGEVVYCQTEGETPYVEVIPTKKIKGDVIVDGSCGTWQNASTAGDFEVVPGKQYLFTWLDENNPTRIFEVTSYDTKTLKLKNVTGDMWERFENYLNDGEYEKAEQDRIDKLNASLTVEGEEISLTALLVVEKDKCDKIEFGILGRQEMYKIEKEKFFELADEIYLTDVKNTLVLSDDAIVISAYEGNSIHTVTMWDKCKVSGYRTAMYSAPQGDYAIKVADYEKLIALFPEEAQPNLPKMKNTYANFVYWVIVNPTTAYTIGALIIIVLFGTIGFAIGYKIKNKKARR